MCSWTSLSVESKFTSWHIHATLTWAALPTCSVLPNLRAFAHAVPNALLYLHVGGYNFFQENFPEPLAPLVLSEQPQHIVVPTSRWHELSLSPLLHCKLLEGRGHYHLPMCPTSLAHSSCSAPLLPKAPGRGTSPPRTALKRPFTQVVLTEPLPCAPPHKCWGNPEV